MAAEENKAIVRQWIDEVWNKHQFDRVAHYYAPTYTLNGEHHSLDRITHMLTDMFAMTPDVHITIDDIIAEGDRVAYRYTWRMTNQGLPQSPFGPIPATGKPITMTSMTFVRLVDGKIVEDWFNSDMLGLYQQLGVIPTGEQPQQATA